MKPIPLMLGLYAATFMLLGMLLSGCGLLGDDSAATDVQVSVEQSVGLDNGSEGTTAPGDQSTGEETENGADEADEDIVEGIIGRGLLIALIGFLLYTGA